MGAVRLNTDPAWLNHLTADRFLNPQQFTQRYGVVVPGAVFTDLYRARALCWQQPSGAGGRQEGR